MRATIVILALAVLSVARVGAHVSVLPRTAEVNGFQEYVVRVPTERDQPTTSVRMVFPEGFEVLRFRPPAPGWRYEVERDANGRITSVTWSGHTIAREEYETFQFMARARTPGVFKLDAYQTYGENDVVAWVNQAEPQPAPQVTIQAAAASVATGADPFASTTNTPTPDTGEAAAPSPSSLLGAGLGGLSLVVALAALAISVRTARRSHPVR